MKETLALRINYDYANMLFKANEGRNLGTSVKVVELSMKDPRYNQVPIIAEEVKKKYNKGFFFSWQIKRKYTREELDKATFLRLKIKAVFEPTGEECGTLYDETTACEICGANRKQLSSLKLRKSTIPKKDIAKTIGGEIVVSEKFVRAVNQRNLKGLVLSPISFEKGTSNYHQLMANNEVELSLHTIAGVDPWDFSEGSEGGVYDVSGYQIKFEKEIYKCPKGHTIGLNILSETYVLDSQSMREYDFFASKQKVGVKRGLLRPKPIFFCSAVFRKMVEEENLRGFEFEIANIE